MGPTSRTKSGHKTAPKIWAPTVGAHILRRKLGSTFGVLVLGTGFPPFFASLSEAKHTHSVQSISPGAHHIALVKDIRVPTILNLRSNIFIKRFPYEGWLPRTYTVAMFVDDYHREFTPIRIMTL